MMVRVRVVALASLSFSFSCLASCSPRAVNRDEASDGIAPAGDGGSPADGALKSCLVGAAFIECPGAGEPAIYCSTAGCKWISTGQPVSPYLSTIDRSCNCTGPTCPPDPGTFHLVMQYGFEPWTRQQDLNVAVTINPALSVTQGQVSCTGCGAGCDIGDTPCSTYGPVGVMGRYMPGTYVVSIWNGGLFGWALELEMDLAWRRARACRIPVRDALSCDPAGARQCATSGSIELAAAPTPESLKVAGKFNVSFADGLNIQGQFTNER